MKRVAAFIDGFNVYYSMDKSADGKYKKYKWLNLRKLLENFLQEDEMLQNIMFFTALQKNETKRMRHLNYLKALKSEGIDYYLGKMRYEILTCPHCGKKYTEPKEKQTDANIISRFMGMAFYKDFDVALIVSADSDLVPMIEATKRINFDIKYRVIVPIDQNARELIQVCDDYKSIYEIHLKNSQFDDVITLPDHSKIERPKEWQ